MKTITTTFNIYNYHELSKDSQEKVKKDLYFTILDDRFYDFENSCIESLKEAYHINNTTVYYSLSYCQGDGFCFTAPELLTYSRFKNHDIDFMNPFELIIYNKLKDNKKLYNDLLYWLSCGYNLEIVKTSWNYEHKYTCSLDYKYNCDEFNNLINFIDSIMNELKEAYYKICDDFENLGYSFYDIKTDDIIEYCDINEYEFYENGSFYY